MDKIEEIARKEVKGLRKKDKEYLLRHPDYIDHHFGYGMYLRNEYIHGKELDPFDPLSCMMPDDASEEIFNKIIELLKQENGS